MRILLAALQAAGLSVFGVLALAYQILARWYASPAGRALMGLTGIICSLLALSLSVSIFGPYPGNLLARAVLYVLLVGGGLAMLRLLLLAQLREPDGPADDTREEKP